MYRSASRPNTGAVNACIAGGKCACVMTLMVARPDRHAAINASVSDWSASTSTNADEPHTTPATPESAAKRQPQAPAALARVSAPRYQIVSASSATCTDSVTMDQLMMRTWEVCGQVMTAIIATISNADPETA